MYENCFPDEYNWKRAVRGDGRGYEADDESIIITAIKLIYLSRDSLYAKCNYYELIEAQRLRRHRLPFYCPQSICWTADVQVRRFTSLCGGFIDFIKVDSRQCIGYWRIIAKSDPKSVLLIRAIPSPAINRVNEKLLQQINTFPLLLLVPWNIMWKISEGMSTQLTARNWSAESTFNGPDNYIAHCNEINT